MTKFQLPSGQIIDFKDMNQETIGKSLKNLKAAQPELFEKKEEKKELDYGNVSFEDLQKSRGVGVGVDTSKEEAEKEKFIQDVIDKINVLVAQAILDQVVAIEVDGQVETNRKEIDDFLEEAEVGLFHELKRVIEKNTLEWRLEPESIKCNECEHEDSVRISLDTSDFFVQG